MQIYLNGELTDTPSQNLLQLIQNWHLKENVLLLNTISKSCLKSKLEQITIAQHDRIEIIHAVGGG